VDDNTVGNESDSLADKGSHKGHCESRNIRFNSTKKSPGGGGSLVLHYEAAFSHCTHACLNLILILRKKGGTLRKVTEGSTQHINLYATIEVLV